MVVVVVVVVVVVGVVAIVAFGAAVVVVDVDVLNTTNFRDRFLTILQKMARNFQQPSDRWSNRQIGSHGEGDNSEGGFERERHLSKFRRTNPGSHEKGGVRMFRMANLILIRWLKGDFKSPHHVEAISSLLPFKYQLRSKKPGGGR